MDPDLEPASLDFEPRRVARGSWGRPAGGVVLLGTAIVALAILTKGIPPDVAPSELPAVPASPAAVDQGIATIDRRRTPPDEITCHELDRPRCLDIMTAALAGLPAAAPPTTGASVWPSLLCDSTMDCPPAQLAQGTPLGSVVLSFSDGGPDAWLNVIDVSAGGIEGAVVEAWIVRWQAPSATSGLAGPVRSGR